MYKLFIIIIYKQDPLLGAKIYSDICWRGLSVPRGKQFSESEVQRKLRALRNRLTPRTNIQELEHITQICPSFS